MAVSIEQASFNALAAHLSSKLAGVDIQDSWPDAEEELTASAITILFAGKAEVTYLDPRPVGNARIHKAISPKVTTAQATTEPTAVALANALKAGWNAHLGSTGATGAHLVADAINTVATVDATNEATAITLANDLRAAFAPHTQSTTFHADAADLETTITAPIAVDTATLYALLNDLRWRINQHYATRAYIFEYQQLEQPIQLDLWTIYQPAREDLIDRLEKAINPSIHEGRHGVVLDLADGWTGKLWAWFDSPVRIEGEGHTKQSEFRANYRGTVEMVRTVTAQTPRLARLIFTASDGAGVLAQETVSPS